MTYSPAPPTMQGPVEKPVEALEHAAGELVWRRACALDDLEPLWGEAALIGGEQVALFRLPDGEVLAVTHRDPFTDSYVMARGIVGSRGDRLTVASPLHKQVYDLRTGECLSSPTLHLRTFPSRVIDGACVTDGAEGTGTGPGIVEIGFAA